MPVINTYDKPAGQVQKGNLVFGIEVKETRPKRVNTTIVLKEPVDGRTEWPFKLTDMLEVGVSEPTPEEQAQKDAEREQFARDYFVSELRSGLGKAEVRREEAYKRLGADWVRSSDVDEFLAADAALGIWKQIDEHLNSAVEQRLHLAHLDGGECEYTERTAAGYRCVKPTVPTTAYDGAVVAVKWLRNSLLTAAMRFRAQSRSTRQMSNHMEDVQLEVIGNIIDSLRWSLPSELRDEVPDRW